MTPSQTNSLKTQETGFGSLGEADAATAMRATASANNRITSRLDGLRWVTAHVMRTTTPMLPPEMACTANSGSR
jgi:hypothetical protein